ncbi:hypothetical protein ACFY4C_30275 [Actinomadura viridis]|uniref:hypothetical protein n=1 Tax=Actinomadura viridis TaxID=58110 RepID=UPI0036C042C7
MGPSRMPGCHFEAATRSAMFRRRVTGAGLCWQRPRDQERRRRHPATSLYRRVGRV